MPSPSPFLVRSLSLPGRVHQATQGEDLARPVQRHTLYLGFRPAKGPLLRSPAHHLAPLPPVSAFGRAGALLLALHSLTSSCSHAVRFCACAGPLAPYSRRGPCAARAPHSARAQNFSFLPAVCQACRAAPTARLCACAELHLSPAVYAAVSWGVPDLHSGLRMRGLIEVLVS